MKLIYFIRLLLKHIVLLIVTPFVLAGLVFFFTKDQPKTYTTSTRIYTGITTGSSIVSLNNTKVDLFATRTAFDNLLSTINSRSTIEEVSLRLLTTHLLLDKPSPEVISEKSFNELMDIVPSSVRDLVVKNNFEQTLANIRNLESQNYTNFVYELINYETPHYSTSTILSNIKVKRVQSSDLIEVSFESDDPGICKGTLEILIQVFMKDYTQLMINQSDAVVRYFQGQLEQASDKLNEAENELLEFNRDNSIINYYEQTRHISREREDFNVKYIDIKFAYAAAESAIDILEKKMSEHQKQVINNEEITDLRKKLSQINVEIAIESYEELNDSTVEYSNTSNFTTLESKALNLENQLKEAVKNQYLLNNSKEGLPSQSILLDWIDKVIAFESAKAKIKVAEQQTLEYDKIYKAYAPLGATMKRLERKISVAEQEYLSLLHSLGVAKLNQQNEELSSNLKIVSPPLFPIMAKPGKRKFLVLVAFMFGCLLPASLIIALEFLDQNIKTTQRAEELTGLTVAAIFPNLNNASKKLNIEFIKKRALDAIARKLILNNDKNIADRTAPKPNLVFSILNGEGKTTLLILLLKKLASIGYSALYLTYNEIEKITEVETRVYKIDAAFHKTEKITDLNADFTGLNINAYDFIFIKIPGILNNSYPINLFKNIERSFLIVRANRAWTKADSNALKDIIEFVPDNKPQIILNGVDMQEMETIIGDLPKSRSYLRRLLKNIFRLRFFSKNNFKKTKGDNNALKETTQKTLFLFIIAIQILFSPVYSKFEDRTLTNKKEKQETTLTINEKLAKKMY